jgi:hypothetical protein
VRTNRGLKRLIVVVFGHELSIFGKRDFAEYGLQFVLSCWGILYFEEDTKLHYSRCSSSYRARRRMITSSRKMRRLLIATAWLLRWKFPYCFGVVVSLWVVTTILVAAPLCNRSKKHLELYFATSVGTRLVYIDAKTECTIPFRVVSSEKSSQFGGVTVSITIEPFEQLGASSEMKYWVCADGVALLTKNGAQWQFKNPLRHGSVWVNEEFLVDRRGIPNETVAVTRTSFPEESVDVPAGRFQAIRVDSEYSRNGHPVRESRWYCRSIGVIKWIVGGQEVQLMKIIRK